MTGIGNVDSSSGITSVHVIKNDTSRVEGQSLTFGIGVNNSGKVTYGTAHSGTAGNIISKKEIDFEAEQELNSIEDYNFKQMFKDLDLSQDGKLSTEELDAYKNYRKLVDENQILKQKLYEIKAKPINYSVMTGIGGSILGTIASYFGFKAVQDNISSNSKMYDIISSGYGNNLNKTSLAVCGAVIGVLSACGAYKYFANKSSNEAEKLSLEIQQNDLKLQPMKEQYKHIDMAQIEFNTVSSQ